MDAEEATTKTRKRQGTQKRNYKIEKHSSEGVLFRLYDFIFELPRRWRYPVLSAGDLLRGSPQEVGRDLRYSPQISSSPFSHFFTALCVTDFGRSNGKPNALSQQRLESTPKARLTANNTV